MQRSKTLPVMHMQPEIVLQCQSENIKNQSSKSEHTAINEDVKKKYEVSGKLFFFFKKILSHFKQLSMKHN